MARYNVAYLYCPKGAPFLRKFDNNKYTWSYKNKPLEGLSDPLNGKVLVECEFEVQEVASEKIDVGVGYEPLFYTETLDDLSKTTNMTSYDIRDCLGCEPNGEIVGYAIHFKNIKVLDAPRELEEFELNNSCCFLKETGRTWKDYPILECSLHNYCRYKDDISSGCDKNIFPVKRVRNIVKVFDTQEINWGYIFAVDGTSLSNIMNGAQTTIIKKDVLKDLIPIDK